MPDLSQFDEVKAAQDAGTSVDITLPDGRPAGFSIQVAGPDSDRARAARDKQIDARIDRRNSEPLRASQLGLEGVRYLADITIGWSPCTIDGADYPYTFDNAVKLYQRFPWMMSQVDEAASSRKVFMKPSETPSSGQSETPSAEA